MATGGWKSQPIQLKLLLPMSLLLAVIGVLRCSSELTPVEDPGTIRVERARVNVPDSLTVMSADSLSSLATRMFVRELRDASSARVTPGEDPAAWAVVSLRLRGTKDGRVELGTVAQSSATRRPIAVSTLADSLYRLRDLAERSARAIAGELDIARAGNSKRESGDSEPEADGTRPGQGPSDTGGR